MGKSPKPPVKPRSTLPLTLNSTLPPSQPPIPSTKQPVTITLAFSQFFSAIRIDYSVEEAQLPPTQSTYDVNSNKISAHYAAVKSFAARNFTIHESGFLEASIIFGVNLAIHTIGLIALRAIANNLSWLGLAGVAIAYYTLSEEFIDLVKSEAKKVSDFIGLEDNLLDTFPIQFRDDSPLKTAWQQLANDVNGIFQTWMPTSPIGTSNTVNTSHSVPFNPSHSMLSANHGVTYGSYILGSDEDNEEFYSHDLGDLATTMTISSTTAITGNTSSRPWTSGSHPASKRM